MTTQNQNDLLEIPSNFLAKLLFFNGKEEQMRLAIKSLKEQDIEAILSRYSEKEEWVHVMVLIVTIHNLPLSKLLLLSKSPSAIIGGLPSTIGIYHSFLWHARYSLVSACAAINPPPPFRFTPMEFDNTSTAPDPHQSVSPHKQDELLEICLFVKSALFQLIEKGGSEPKWYQATCCQIAFEIGNYYWLIDEYEMTLEMMNLCRDLILSYDINLEDENEIGRDWIDFDLIQITKIIDICNVLLGKSEEGQASLFSKLSTFLKSNEPEFIMMLLDDFVDQVVPLGFKRVLLQDAINENSSTVPVIALIVALCVCTNTLTMKSDSKEFQEFQNDKTMTRIGKIRRELMPIETKVLLDLLQTARERVPMDLIDDWTFVWQVICFVEMVESAEKQILFANHPFIQSFLNQHKDLLFSSIKDDSDTTVDDRSKTINSFNYFVREMLFTKIRPGEVQYLPNLANLASEKGAAIIPHILKLAERHVMTEPLVSLQLIDICQKVPIQSFSTTPGFSREDFERELTPIQRDAVVSALVERAEECRNDALVIGQIISQFITTEDLMSPSSLLLFSKSLKIMIIAADIESAFTYTTNVFTRVGMKNPSLAKAMHVLGNSVSLLFQVEANLITQKVLVPGEDIIDIHALNSLEEEPVTQYCLLSLQLLTWLCKDLMESASTVSTGLTQGLAELQSKVFTEIVRYLKGRHPGMTSFIFGCLGGRISRHLSKEKMLNLDLLGPAAVFSFPFKGFSDIPTAIFDPPNQIRNQLDQLLLRVRHDSEIPSSEVIQGGLRLLKMIVDDQIKSVDLEEKRVHDYLMQGDIAFSLGDYSSAIRAYLNEILVGGQYGESMELLLPYREGNFFKKMADTLVFLKDPVHAAFFLQFVLPFPSYKEIFSRLGESIPQLSGSIAKDEVVYDPPWKQDASPVYAFFDSHVMEYLISTLNQTGKDDKIVKMLIARIKSPLFDPHDSSVMSHFITHLLNWVVQRLCSKYAPSP